MGILLAISALLGGILAFIAGFVVGIRADARRQLADLGYTRKTIRLYREAVVLLDHLVHVDDLNSELDQLTTQTRERITRWLDAYRKETNRT